jgi:hypothetical protein
MDQWASAAACRPISSIQCCMYTNSDSRPIRTVTKLFPSGITP